MPNILLKKTFKIKPSGFSVKAEKTLTFHGSMSNDMINLINQRVGLLRLVSAAGKLTFRMDSYGHFAANMNHDFQKFHEEDAVVAILDIMQELGFDFKFQYDQEIHSDKVTGSSYTKREVFVFNKA